MAATSHFLAYGLAEKAGRLDQQDDDQDGKTIASLSWVEI